MAVRSGKREKRNVPKAIISVRATFNNTIVSVSDLQGNVICWASCGTEEFKNSRKGTPFAAQIAAESAARKAVNNGVREAEINIKGPGSGREGAIRAIAAAGIKVTLIKDITPVPHNGCRPRKKRNP